MSNGREALRVHACLVEEHNGMKRWFGVLLAAAVASAAMAQAPFTIVSPRNYNPDTKSPVVREKVVLRFPKGSVPSGGYIGIFMGKTRGDRVLDEKFIEATVPVPNGRFLEYTLDTKGRNLPDDLYTIRAVLYVDFSDRPREIGQTQVNVRVGNTSTIRVPENGWRLRYGFRPGTQSSYTVQRRISVAAISSVQNSLGGRATEAEVQNDTIRMLYAVDSVLGNGDAILRLQPLPERGKDHAWVITTGNDQPEKYYFWEMAPIYLRVTGTGMPVFGAVPSAIGSSDFVPLGASGGTRVDLYAALALPTLPSKPVKPGDSWQGRFLQSNLDLEKRLEQQDIFEKIPARGEFLGVEFEMGRPCAKMRYSLTQSNRTRQGQQLQAQGREMTGDERQAIEETFWFALDTGQVVKSIRTITIDTRVAPNLGTQTGNQGGAAPAGGSPAGIDSQGASGSRQTQSSRQANSAGLGAARGGSGEQNARGGQPGGRGQGFGSQQQAQLMRYRIGYTFTLER